MGAVRTASSRSDPQDTSLPSPRYEPMLSCTQPQGTGQTGPMPKIAPELSELEALDMSLQVSSRHDSAGTFSYF